VPAPRINVLLNGERLDDRALALLTRLEVRESDADPTVAALRFRLTQQPDGAFFPLDEDLFEPAAGLAVDVEAPGGLPQRLFDGYTTHVRPHFETIEANCYLEVLAMDAAVLLDAADRVAAYPDASDSEAAEEVLGRYQIPFVGEATAARFKADHQLLVQRETDWQFVRRLARRNGYVCYFEHDPDRGEVVGHFHPRAVGATPQADLTILREDTTLRWIDLQLVMTGPVRHAGAAIDPIRKRLLRSAGEPALPALGEEGLAEAIEEGLVRGGAESATALLCDPFPLDPALAAAATGATDLDRFVIEARGEVNPELYRGLIRARRPGLVKGVGRKLSGTYYVRTVRTTVEGGALTQTFVAERNALGQTGEEAFGQEAEEVPAE
jgi:hypothetical protein